MTWTVENQRNDEASKIRWDLVPYMHGVALDIGCGAYKVFPHFIGVDNGHHWGQQQEAVHVETAEKLPFLDSYVDCVFSSHLLEHIEDWRGALKEWWRVLKPGGHLCLYLPHKDLYPNCDKRAEWNDWYAKNGPRFKYRELAIEAFAEERAAAGAETVGAKYAGTPYCNPDHKQDFLPADVIGAMEKIGGWDLVANEERSHGDEYSIWQVFKKLDSAEHRHSWRAPKPEKTCAIVRYGAIGDMIQMSSILPWLKEQGYHVTVYCQSGQGHEAVKHDPNIDRFIVQGKDHVPNQFLEEFWSHERAKYTKWVNLCESVEGTLLANPGRSNWEWPNELRAKYLDRNYLEWTHELAGVPAPYRPKFYSTPKEREKARWQASKWGRRNILWSLAGSSGHKVWPHLDAVMDFVLRNYADTHFVLVGDESCKLLEQGWCKWDEGAQDFVETVSRVHLRSGKWSIRESLAFAEVADLVIGTETGLLNAAGSMDCKKIITLSHSSQEMLTKHWKNTTVLDQPQGVGCAKHPCRQLHGGGGADPWKDCPQEPVTGTALCQYHIGAEQMIQAVMSSLGLLLRRVA